MPRINDNDSDIQQSVEVISLVSNDENCGNLSDLPEYTHTDAIT